MPKSFADELADVEFSFVTPADVRHPKPRRPFPRELGVSDFSRVDGRTKASIEKGGFRPQASLDLHGKTVPAAFEKFLAFVNSNYDSQTRRLLVVTGKGSKAAGETPAAVARGVIKNAFPRWLSDPLVRDKILAAAPASVAHGGPGAFYILLRKK
jgi:DNA-nicking Smr family endonuclease